jgi:hypothetical protein
MSERQTNPEEQEASRDEQIVEANFGLMTTSLRQLLMDESMSGNARDVQIEGQAYSCLAANGYANQETGEIGIFSNSQYLPQEFSTENGFGEFTLRIVFDLNKNRPSAFYRIIGDVSFHGFNQDAQRRLMKSVQKYNQAFDVE